MALNFDEAFADFKPVTKKSNVGGVRYYDDLVRKYDPIINEASKMYNVDKNLIRGVMRRESAGVIGRKSHAGAQGLMQLMPATGREMGVKDPYDPRDNIFGGVKYLRKMIDMFDGNIELALAAYNAGPGKVRKHKGIPPLKETQEYVPKVLEHKKRFLEQSLQESPLGDDFFSSLGGESKLELDDDFFAQLKQQKAPEDPKAIAAMQEVLKQGEAAPQMVSDESLDKILPYDVATQDAASTAVDVPAQFETAPQLPGGDPQMAQAEGEKLMDRLIKGDEDAAFEGAQRYAKQLWEMGVTPDEIQKRAQEFVGEFLENKSDSEIVARNVVNRLPKGAARAQATVVGAFEQIPFVGRLLDKDGKEVAQAIKERSPGFATAGAIGMQVAQMINAAGIVGNVGKIKQAANAAKTITNPIMRKAAEMGVKAIPRTAANLTVTGANMADAALESEITIAEAIKKTAESATATAVSVAPEVLLPMNAIQPFAQALTGVATNYAIDKAAGNKYDESEKIFGIPKNYVIEGLADFAFGAFDINTGKQVKAPFEGRTVEIRPMYTDVRPQFEAAEPVEADFTARAPKPGEADDAMQVMGREPTGATTEQLQQMQQLEPEAVAMAPEPVPEGIDITAREPVKATPEQAEALRMRDEARERATAEAEAAEMTATRPVEGEPTPAEKITGMQEEPSPLVMGGIAAGQELPKFAKNINLERIDADYSPKKAILETSASYAKQIDKARRGKIKREVTREMADQLGMTEETLLKRKKGEVWNAEQALAARDLLNASAQRISRLQRELNAKPALSDQDIADFRLEMQKHAAIQAEVSGLTAEAGRLLGQFNIMSRAKGEAKSAQELLDIVGGKDINRDMVEKIARIDPDDIGAVSEAIKTSTFKKAADVFNEYWINAILSAPTTQTANAFSNAATALYRPLIEKPVSSLLSLTQPKGKRTYIGEVPSELMGMAKAFPDGLRSFAKSFTGQELPSAGKLETVRVGAIPGWPGKLIRTPGRTLQAADEFFKHVINRGTISSLAYRKAKSEGLKGQKLAARTAELTNNPTEGMVKKAKEEADYRTFTKPLGKFGSSIMRMRNEAPGLKYVIPFIRTPTNIAKFAIERTPLGFVDKIKKIAKKEISGDQIGEELAKPIAGSALMAATVMLAQQGLITGAGPKDKKERYALYRTGWQPYSVRVGDHYYSFARLEPLGSILGMAADFASLQEDDKTLDQIAERMVYSFGRNITSKTFMQGVSKLMDAMSDPRRHGERWLQQMAGSIIPNIIARGATASDSELKKIDGIIDLYQSRVPGLTQFVYPERDVWGRKIDRAGNFWTRFVSPVQYSAAKGDKVDLALVENDIVIGQPSRKITVNREQVELSPELYDEYSKKAGERAYALVSRVINSTGFSTRDREVKEKLVKGAVDRARSVERAKIARKVRNQQRSAE